LWLAGLIYFFAARVGKRYCMIGWMYLAPMVLFFIARGRPYYLAPAYPMLLAAGAVWGEQWTNSLPFARARIVRRTTWGILMFSGVVIATVVLPIARRTLGCGTSPTT
jgi:hypothetical protein